MGQIIIRCAVHSPGRNFKILVFFHNINISVSSLYNIYNTKTHPNNLKNIVDPLLFLRIVPLFHGYSHSNSSHWTCGAKVKRGSFSNSVNWNAKDIRVQDETNESFQQGDRPAHPHWSLAQVADVLHSYVTKRSQNTALTYWQADAGSCLCCWEQVNVNTTLWHSRMPDFFHGSSCIAVPSKNFRKLAQEAIVNLLLLSD